MESARNVFGNPRGDVDLRRPFGDRAEHLAVIDFLKRLAVHHVAADLADQHDHRRRILEGGVDADRGVAGARAARYHADSGLAGQLAVGLGHVGGAGLVAGVDELEAVAQVEQRIQHFQIALARHAEGHVRAVDQELIDQDLAAGARIGKGQGHRIVLQESRLERHRRWYGYIPRLRSLGQSGRSVRHLSQRRRCGFRLRNLLEQTPVAHLG